ncbi:MAG: DUF2490 domain-containing protein [Flavobacteriales bacterium]|nr:DUF2490 domain-containing protein [Flavobacteriales bacterium]MBP9080794.1 DUF2490 domain-containing protein [Flavobacteriales bacterium]
MNALRHSLALLLSLALVGNAHAQREADLRPGNDAQLWLSAGTEFKPFRKPEGQITQTAFFRKLRATGELESRFSENASRFRQFNITGGLFYPITKYLRVGSEYRYSFRDRYTTNKSRMDAQLRLKWKTGRLDGNFRCVWQHSFEDVTGLRTELRNRLGLEYDFRQWKLDPVVNVETFTALHYTGNRMVGMRYDLGTKLNLDKDKKNTLEVTLRHDREINRKEPDHEWILALAYEFDFKKK